MALGFRNSERSLAVFGFRNSEKSLGGFGVPKFGKVFG